MQGFLNLNKPAGFTSHDCVACVRRLLRLKRVGHGGTLDPTATGVLPIAVGRATRVLQYLQQDKAYRATIRFGVQTTTDDLEGEVLHAEPAPQLTLEAIAPLLPKFQGEIQQIPPSYSAIQVEGKRLYDLARSGQAVEAPVRTVNVYQIEVLDWRPGQFPELEVAIACGPGTYIRSIARDLGDALGVGGTLATLIRTESSGFKLENSLTLEDLTAQVEQNQFEPIAPEQALLHWPTLELPAEEARRWRQGQKILITSPTSGEILRIYDETQRLLGLTQVVSVPEGLVLVPKLVLEPI